MLPFEFDPDDKNRVYESMTKFFKRSPFDHKELWTVLGEIIRDSGYLYKDVVEVEASSLLTATMSSRAENSWRG